jgi:hypothetical protein
VARLALVYDADGGLVGEVRYVVGHLLGRAECALCDITHGPVKRKADFDALVARLEADGHHVEVHHRNEQSAAQAAASTGHLPCVLVADVAEGPWAVLVSADELRSCGGDVGAFGEVLASALSPGRR